VTASMILDIYFSTVHDEYGNFHGATKENPMAKIENMCTKKIVCHHLTAIEVVQHAKL
jgi:hypothetical protein